MKQDSSTLPISVTIITKNEAHNIRRCLESVKFLSNEIIILDSGSTDDTLAICREYTPHVHSTDWPGFGPQKNRALNKATQDWVLSLDADEWLSPELITEIKQKLQSPQADAYDIPRRTRYLGQVVRYGDVGRDRVLRLFRRDRSKFSNDVVHEKVIVDGSVEYLKRPIEHNSYPTVESIMSRMNYYTTLSAEKSFERGKRTSFSKAIISALWAFLKAYVVRLGFLDGKIGFIVAVTSAESSYYRHIKLLQLWNQKK